MSVYKTTNVVDKIVMCLELVLVKIVEELIVSGKWLYDEAVDMEAHIIKTNFKPGSGDHEDEPVVREDRFGEFYGLHIGAYSNTSTFQGGAYSSIEEAQKYASTVCPSLVWNKREPRT
ncbi:hypothetical protein ATS74_08100 [Pseudoalteromonas sp. H103]|nr:hypothetical protein ATS74_08100 [Pseudoalteromonas sp. H103]